MNKFLSINSDLEQLEIELEQIFKTFNLVAKSAELEELKLAEAAPDFWQQDQARTQAVYGKRVKLERFVQPWLNLKADFKDLVELVKSCDQEAPQADNVSELRSMLDSLAESLTAAKEQLRFNGPYDDHDVIVNILAGAGGTDAQDWARMLLRMYTRWAESQNIKLDLVSQSKGEEAGLKSASLHLRSQPFLYGQLKEESGVHRLVRLSPFNAQNLRQTSFAKVEVIPALEQSDLIEINETDLRIDTYRSSGHGGQSVNTTDSAVRVTHLPTNTTVTIQNERSQSQNKELALMVLRSKLEQLRARENARLISDIKGKNVANEWGSQIRNYVLHPYKQVKDLRSGYVTGDVNKILDGDLEELLKSNLIPTDVDKD